MGKLLKPKGLKGELRAIIFNEKNFSLKIGTEIWLEEDFSWEIEKIQVSVYKSYIKLVGCNSREEAEKIQGKIFSLPRDHFEKLDHDEYYLVDLIGCQVIDCKQNFIGIVVDILNMPAQNLIVVDRYGDEILIPHVDSHVSFFDKKKKNLIVQDIEGLID